MSDISNLPDEVILDMCTKMNIQDLNNFIQSTSRNYQICNEVLIQRKKIIETKVDEIFRTLKSSTVKPGGVKIITLQSDSSRVFELYLYAHGYNFYILERIYEKISAAQKLNTRPPEVLVCTGSDTEKKARDMVFKLFVNGYLDENVIIT